MENYYYELKYVNGEETVIHKFSADTDVYELGFKLRDFLRGCNWTDNLVNSILKSDEEEDDV